MRLRLEKRRALLPVTGAGLYCAARALVCLILAASCVGGWEISPVRVVNSGSQPPFALGKTKFAEKEPSIPKQINRWPRHMMHTNIRLVRDDDDREELSSIINRAYCVGEIGIVVDNPPDDPFERVTYQDLTDMIKKRQLLVLDGMHENGKSAMLGCIKVSKLPVVDSSDSDNEPETKSATSSNEDNEIDIPVVGGWGCLAVDLAQQGHGYGLKLIRAAEDYLTTQLHCTHAQLEILSPTNWTHEHKERLRSWYTKRLGYQLLVPDDYKASSVQLKAGTKLGERCRLAVDADYTAYRKRL